MTVQWIALTRPVSPSIARCELTYLERQPIDYDPAQRQHHSYQACLESLGCRVESLPSEPELPDAVFVEDIAIVLDEVAVITRPGAESRRPEIPSVVSALQVYRPLVSIVTPGTLDGGDVLLLDKTLYVGISSRSNLAGIEQLRALLESYGYDVLAVPLTGCLHLKSAVTQIGKGHLLLNPHWISPADFPGYRCLEIDPGEPHAANALLVGDGVIYPTAYPQTRMRMESVGVQVISVEVSELIKAEGAVTCCSLIFKDNSS